MYRNVLVAVELNAAPARFVLERAREFLAADGVLSAVHVVEPQFVQYSVDPTFRHSVTHGLERDALDTAAARLAQLCEPYGIDPAHQHVALGRAADRIHQLAEQSDADLIVIGSHGQEGLRRLLGSTANAVLHNAPVDVATVRLPREL